MTQMSQMSQESQVSQVSQMCHVLFERPLKGYQSSKGRTTRVAVEHWQLCDVTDNESSFFVYQTQKVVAVFLTRPTNWNHKKYNRK